MDLYTRYISLYTGSGQLDKGFERGIIELGLPEPKPVCYVERDFQAAALLVDKIQAGKMGKAPVWTDSSTIDCDIFGDKVDAIIGGFPCQPFSLAGKGAGEEDERWLWEDIKRLAIQIRPKFLFLENVSGLIVGHGLNTILGDFTEIGYDAEWISIQAKHVGASHKRERVFILAYTNNTRNRSSQHEDKCKGKKNIDKGKTRSQSQSSGYNTELDDTEHNGCSTTKITGNTRQRSNDSEKRSKESKQSQRSSKRISQTSDMVNSDSKRRCSRNNARQNAMDVITPDTELYGKPTFAPGPDDIRWTDIIRFRPDLAPALENTSSFRRGRWNNGLSVDEKRKKSSTSKVRGSSGKQKEIESEVRGMADGMGRRLDSISRIGQLRLLGNGVVPQQATAALKILFNRI